MSEEYTPSEEEVRHDYSCMVDWRYDQRYMEFDRMLAKREEPVRAVLANMENLIQHSAVLSSDFEEAAKALRKALDNPTEGSGE